MIDRTPMRREALAKDLTNQGVAAFLVSAPSNVRYLSGFTGEDSVLFMVGDRSMMISDGRFETQLKQECPGLEAHIRPVSQTLFESVAEVVAKLGVGRLAFEAPALSVADHEALREQLPTIALQGTRDLVERLRAIKDEDEIAAIREAIDYAEQAFAMLCEELRPGASEKDVADTLEGHLRRCGATGSSFPPIVAVGRHAALPHARPRPDTRIGDDDFVLFDWGATGTSYKSDLTRVRVTGKVTPTFESVYRTVLEAQERAIASIRPGVIAGNVDTEARSVIEDAGFGRFFDHGLGHGIGIDIHEAPRLRKGSQTVLEAGMVLTVEPGIYLPDWGGIRIEDDVLVTPDGCEVLSHVPRSLDAVRLPR